MQDNTTLGTLTLGGSSVLNDLQNVSMRSNPTHNETKSLKMFGKKRQLSKMELSWTVDLYSTDNVDDVRIDFFNITSIELGGTDIRCDLYSFEIEGSFDRKPDPGYCSKWMKNSNKAKDYRGTMEVGVPDAGYAALLVASMSTDEADRRMILEAVINGVAVELPVTLGEIQYAIPDADDQKVTLTILGNAPTDGSAYPTSPTGTATFLEWAFNAAKTTKAILFKSNNTVAVGVSVSGNVTVSSFRFGARDGEVLISTYELTSYGTMTVAATT